MKSLDIEFLRRQAIPFELGGLLQKLGSSKTVPEMMLY